MRESQINITTRYDFVYFTIWDGKTLFDTLGERLDSSSICTIAE